MEQTRASLRWIVLGLGLVLTTCGDDKGPECESSGDCVGRPAGNQCKTINSKARCVIECIPPTAGADTCPPTYACTGKADDGSMYCK